MNKQLFYVYLVMAYLLGTTGAVSINDSIRPELSNTQSDQLEACNVFADPTEVIKEHPDVLDFYNGKTDKLEMQALFDYCCAIDPTCKITNNTLGSGIAIGKNVLWGLPKEKTESTFLSWVFAKKHDSLNSSDKDTIRDFLQSVLETPKTKIVHEAKTKQPGQVRKSAL